MFIFVESAAVLVPQSAILLGSEIVASNLAALISLAGINIAHRLIHNIDLPVRLIVGALTWVIGLAGGIFLILQSAAGLYLVTASILFGLCVIVYNAWSMLLTVSEEDAKSKS